MHAWCPYGPSALLLSWRPDEDAAAFQALRGAVRWLSERPPAGVADWAAGWHSLLIEFGPSEAGRLGDREGVRRLLAELEAASSSGRGTAPGRVHELPVDYSGPDLAAVAARAGLTPAEAAALHAAGDYEVRCVGFAPGFPYLSGLDPRLNTPRLATPRPRVAAGAVAIGGAQSGVYTLPTPGGWNVLGYTPERLFQPAAASVEEMFRLRLGDRLRFVPQPGCAPLGQPEFPASEWPADQGGAALRVIAPGIGLQLVDPGRPGFRRFGVPRGGPADPEAAAWANQLLENSPAAAVLELCFQGQKFEAEAGLVLSLTGAHLGAVVRRRAVGREEPLPPGGTFRLEAGDQLEFRRCEKGVFAYLGAPAGWGGPAWLGSRCGYARAGLAGLPPVGVRLAAGAPQPPWWPHIAGHRVPWTALRDYARPPALRVRPGPQWAWFEPAERARFFSQSWPVQPRSDRSGWRLGQCALAGPARTLWSEPVIPGAIQVPPDGMPIVTLPDGPTVGGYPKLGVVEPESLAWLAQARPGQWVRFEPVDEADPQVPHAPPRSPA